MSRNLDPPPEAPELIHASGFRIGASDTVVDVGCGPGAVCAYAGRLGASVIGLYIDQDSLDIADAAMKTVNARSWKAILGNCDPIPLPDDSASVVICTEVLEHVDDPGRLIAELVRIGKPGARYLLSVPDPASESVMQVVAPDWYWNPPYHRRIFPRDDFGQILESAGLSIDQRLSSGFFQSLWWIFRMALGAQPYQPTPDAAVLKSWEATWTAVAELPNCREIDRALSGLVPKSQIVVARKSAGSASRPKSVALSRNLRSISVKSGTLRLGGVELKWSFRRSKTGEAA